MKTNTLLLFSFLMVCLLFQYLSANSQNKDAIYRQTIIGTWIVSRDNEAEKLYLEVAYDKNGNYQGVGFVISKANNVRNQINYSGSWSIVNSQLKENTKESNIPALKSENSCTILAITPKSFAYQFKDGTIEVNTRKIEAIRSETEAQGSTKSANVSITPADIDMAQEIINKNTYTLPGAAIGSTFQLGPGPFSPADALVIYMLKFHLQTKSCPPLPVVIESLQKLNDAESSKIAVAAYWQQYSGYTDLDLNAPNYLHDWFNNYIVIKFTKRTNAANARLEGSVGAAEAWSKAMSSQQKSMQKSADRQDDYILNRDTYRGILNSQAAVDAAAKAVAGGY